MRRRTLLTGGLAALLLAATPLAARQAPPGRVPRVGVLSPQHATESPTVQRQPFEQGLRDLGWMPGSNILIELRYAEGDPDHLPELAADLVRLKVDVIVVRGPQATQAARQATSTIPIVMSATPDPVGSGFVASLNRPGGNITGLAFLAEGLLDDKRLELLKEAVPKLTRVAVLSNPLALQAPTALSATASLLGLQLQPVEIRTSSGLPEVFEVIDHARAGALLVREDPHILEPHRAEVVALASERRLPAIYPWRLYVDAGGLMSYGTSIPEFHRRSAAYVDKILKGAKPADLPVEQPTKFELVINLKAAKALGLALPDTLLDRADEVIE